MKKLKDILIIIKVISYILVFISIIFFSIELNSINNLLEYKTNKEIQIENFFELKNKEIKFLNARVHEIVKFSFDAVWESTQLYLNHRHCKKCNRLIYSVKRLEKVYKKMSGFEYVVPEQIYTNTTYFNLLLCNKCACLELENIKEEL